MNRLIPLNLQFFADGGEDEGAAKQEAAEKPDTKEPSGPRSPSPYTPNTKPAPQTASAERVHDVAAGTVVSRVLSLDDHLSTPHVAARLKRSL